MSNSPRSSFSLSGPSITLDPRVHAVRGDLADIALAGQLFAPHYARPMSMHCAVPSIMLHDAPSSEGKAISQLLFGEEFMVVDISAGWAWGYCRHDHYVGYLPETALAALEGNPIGTVTVRSASLYAAPDNGSAMVGELPMGSTTFGNQDGAFVHTALGYVNEAALDGSFADHAEVAESLIDTPYVWGGRTSDGIDCSGLVQLALALTGKSAPRDSDQQQDALGNDIAEGAPFQRGDLVFFPGHVGIMADAETLLHATMHCGKVVAEPLADVVARFDAEHPRAILARKRIG